MQCLEAELVQRVPQVRHALAVQRIAQAIPWLLFGGAQIAPVQQHRILVAAQLHRQAVVAQVGRTAQVLQLTRMVAEGHDGVVFARKREAFGKRALPQLAGALVHVRGGDFDRAAGARIGVVVEHDGALVPMPIGIGKDVLVYRAVAGPEVIQNEVGAFGKDVPLL